MVVRPETIAIRLEQPDGWHKKVALPLTMQFVNDMVGKNGRFIQDFTSLTAAIRLVWGGYLSEKIVVAVEMSDFYTLQEPHRQGCVIHDQSGNKHYIDGRVLLQYYLWARDNNFLIRSWKIITSHE